MTTFLAALLFSTSSFATDFTCQAFLEGKEIARESVTITDEANTEIYLGTYKDVELIGTAIFGQVSAFMITDGVMFGTISMNAASYRMYLVGEGELQLDCALTAR